MTRDTTQKTQRNAYYDTYHLPASKIIFPKSDQPGITLLLLLFLRATMKWGLLATVFLGVQLSAETRWCSAASISANEGFGHPEPEPERNRNEHNILPNTENAGFYSQAFERYNTSISEINKLMLKILRDTEQGVNVKEDNSMKSIISPSNAQQIKNQQSMTRKKSSFPSKSVQRQTRDVEDILNEMTNTDPQDWSAIDWIVLILFLMMFCWIYSCIFALCCCGRGGGGGGSTILNWLCFWEICCRDGRDLEECCNYANASIV